MTPAASGDPDGVVVPFAQPGSHAVLGGDLAAYALDALPAAETAALERHLAGCAECLEELPQLRAAAARLSAVPREALLDGPPVDADDFLRRTIARASAEATGDDRNGVRWRRYVAIALAVVGAVLVGTLLAVTGVR